MIVMVEKKCLLLIGEQPLTIGILGETKNRVYRENFELDIN